MLVTTATVERVLRALERRPLVVDLETTGLRPYHGDRLFGIAVVGPDPADLPYYFPFRHRGGAVGNLGDRALVDLLRVIRTAPELGGHNFIRFDCSMLALEDEATDRALLGRGGVPCWDTMIDALLANENEESFSLEALGIKYLGADDSEKREQNAKLLEALRQLPGASRLGIKALKGRMCELTPQQVEPYACGDVLDTRALRERYVRHHVRWGLLDLAAEMYDYARLLACIERRGLLIDRGLAERRIPQLQAREAAVLAEIRDLAGPTFNPQSPVQVCRLLGTPDAQKSTLEGSPHPVAKKIIERKRLGKVRSTYYEAILAGLDAHNVIHPQLNLTPDPTDVGGTKSGRLSCSNPNFQNLPKRAVDPLFAVRELVIARPGHTLLVNDYERAEMWMGGHYSGDDALFEAYHAGRDLYSELAAQAGCDRQQGKITWLAIQYGAGAWKIASMFGWPFRSVADLERAFDTPADRWGNAEWEEYKAQPSVRVRDSFFELVPGVKKMMNRLAERAQENGVLRLWTGRVCHFDGKNSPAFTAWNRTIQGAVGEMMRLAMQGLEAPLADLGAHQLLQVHDELVVECPTDDLARVQAVVEAGMTSFDFRLPPRVEAKVGQNYHGLRPFEAAKQAA